MWYLHMCRVLMWRRSDNICFALLLGGDDSVTVGERVECKVKGILQVDCRYFMPENGQSMQ